MALDADVKNSTFSDRFEKAFPERFYQAFIAEQVMVGAAMGFAARGAIPFPSTFACFLTRAYDFIRMAAISNTNIKLAGSHAGVSIGEDGPSQMALEDLAALRTPVPKRAPSAIHSRANCNARMCVSASVAAMMRFRRWRYWFAPQACRRHSVRLPRCTTCLPSCAGPSTKLQDWRSAGTGSPG